MRTYSLWIIKFYERPAAQLPSLPRTNLQDTAAESKDFVMCKSEVIGVLHFGFLLPFVSIKEIPRQGHDGMETPEAMVQEILDLLSPFR